MTKPSEALLLGLYNVIGTLARQGYEKGIFCCLAGSHYEKKSKSKSNNLSNCGSCFKGLLRPTI